MRTRGEKRYCNDVRPGGGAGEGREAAADRRRAPQPRAAPARGSWWRGRHRRLYKCKHGTHGFYTLASMLAPTGYTPLRATRHVSGQPPTSTSKQRQTPPSSYRRRRRPDTRHRSDFFFLVFLARPSTRVASAINVNTKKKTTK